MAEPGKSIPKPAWLTLTLFAVLFIGIGVILRPYALEIMPSRILADAAAGGFAGLVAWPIAGFIVRSLVRK